MGTRVAAVGVRARHALTIFETETQRLLLQASLFAPIESAVFAPTGDSVFVSLERSIARVDLRDQSVVHPYLWASGQLAIDASGSKLAVHGSLLRSSFGGRLSPEFGIYDLREEVWLARANSPIQRVHAIGFDGDEAVAYGLGGRLMYRAATSFRGHIRLNAETGKATVQRGEELARGHEGADGYQVPELIQGWLGRAEALRSSTPTNITPSNLVVRQILPLATSDSCQIAVRYETDRVGTGYAVFNMTDAGVERLASVWADTPWEIIVIDHSFWLAWRSGTELRLLALDDERRALQAADAAEQAALVFAGDEPSWSEDLWSMPLPSGVLTLERPVLRFYDVPSAESSWTLPVADGQNIAWVQASANGRWLAVHLSTMPSGPKRCVVVDTVSGAVVHQVEFSRDSRSSIHPGALSSLGSFAYRESLSLASVAGYENRVVLSQLGEEPVRMSLAKSDLIARPCFAGEQLLVTGPVTRRWDGSQWGPAIAFPELSRSLVLPGHVGLALAENRYGQTAILNLTNDAVVRRWTTHDYESSSLPTEYPTHATPIFDERLLLLGLAPTNAAEVVDLQTLETLAVLNFVVSGGKLQVLVTTPDGLWDGPPVGDTGLAGSADDRPLTAVELEARQVVGLLSGLLTR